MSSLKCIVSLYIFKLEHTMNHEETFLKLTKCAEDKALLLKPKKTPELLQIVDKYEISLEEATLFIFILNKFVQSGRSVSMDDVEDNDLDIKVGNNNYLKIIKSLRNLVKKDLVCLEKHGRHSSLMNPDVNIDESVFSQIIFGSDIFDTVDFSNIYSVVQAVDTLLEQRDAKKISEKRFFNEFERLLTKIDKSLVLYTLLMPYSIMEQLMIFRACIQKIKGYNGEECNRFATEIYDNLSDVARFMENIYKDTFKCFKDKVLKLDENSAFRSDPNFELTSNAHQKIFGSKIKNKNEFKALFSKHLKHSSFKQELFLDEKIANTTHTIAKAVSKKEYTNIVKQLKNAHLPSGIVSLLYGYPGTGKTATVYEISKLTKRDVLQVDISCIRDKYVGESEKRLKAIFDEYARAKEELKHTPILLFNEADALIGQRMQANDSVDVMNNAMQNILLEELEKFEGIFFATTNLIDNMDSAFDRRFLYKVEFSKPTSQTRVKIWRAKLPNLKDEDIDAIAHYDLSGGQIENVSRKYMLDTILNLKTFDIHELKKLCESESNFKKDTTCKSIGFAA